MKRVNKARATALLSCAVVAALIAVGCTSGHGAQPGKMLSYGGLPQDGTACVPALAGASDATYGFTSVNNTDSSPITLTGVRLLEADGLAIEKAYVLAIPMGADVGAIGNSSGWPPAEWQLKYVPGALGKLAALDGFIVPPRSRAKASQISGYNVVLHLTVSSLPARFNALRIYYVRGSGGAFYQDTTVSLEVRAPCEAAS